MFISFASKLIGLSEAEWCTTERKKERETKRPNHNQAINLWGRKKNINVKERNSTQAKESRNLNKISSNDTLGIMHSRSPDFTARAQCKNKRQTQASTIEHLVTHISIFLYVFKIQKKTQQEIFCMRRDSDGISSANQSKRPLSNSRPFGALNFALKWISARERILNDYVLVRLNIVWFLGFVFIIVIGQKRDRSIYFETQVLQILGIKCNISK